MSGMRTPTAEPAIDYPSSDGQPMAETPVHVEAIMLLHQALQDFFADRPDVFVASDIFWYWEEGNPNARISPDVMAVPGVAALGVTERRSFFGWREGGAMPAVVFEMASKGTWEDDLGDKYDTYERLGVREYVLFDPDAEYLDAPLMVFRLKGRKYGRRRSADGVYESELGFRMRAEGTLLRLIDARTGVPIPTRAERADAERQRADAERRQADAERQRADAERQRGDALALEVERLKALMRQHGLANGNAS